MSSRLLTTTTSSMAFNGELVVLMPSLSAETSLRTAADTSLSIICSNMMGTITTSSLDTLAELASALSNDPSFVFNLSAEVSTETGSRISADASLSTADASLSTADASLSTGLSSETSSRISGDDSLSTGLSSEISSRISGDASLSTGLSSETSSRISGDASLSTQKTSNINTLSSANTAAQSGTGPGYINTTASSEITLNGTALGTYGTGTNLFIPANIPWTSNVNVTWQTLTVA